MTKHTAPSPNRIRRAPALVAVFGGAGFVAFFVVAHLVQPTVDGSWQPPSELALGANGWAMTIAFLMLGVAGIGLFLALTSDLSAPTMSGRVS